MKINQLLGIKDFETKTLFKNSSWVLGGNIFRAFLVFFKGIIIARGLGVELFGTFNIIAAFAGLVHQFFAFPISSTIIKYGATYLTDKRYDKLAALVKSGFLFSFILAICSTLVIVLLTLFVYDVFIEDPDLEKFVVVYAVVAATAFIDGISSTLMRLFYKFKENSFIVIASAFIELVVVGLTVYLYPKNFLSFFIAFFISKICASILLNFVSFKYTNSLIRPFWKTPINVLAQEKKEIVNYTLANSGSRALKTVINNGDVLLLGAILGPIPVAFYNIAKKLAQSILILIDPITHTLFPQTSLLISEKKFSEVAVMIRKITGLIVVPAALFVAGIYVFRHEIILYTYGSEYLQAAEPFLYLGINAVLGAILFWNLPLILSLGMVKFRLVVNSICLCLGGLFAYLMIGELGATAVAIGLLLANGSAIIVFSLATYLKISKN